MDEVFRSFRNFFFLLFAVALLAPAPARAIGIDILGELTQPIIGPAKERMKSMVVYIWLQPYAGYAWGSSDQSRVSATSVATKLDGLSVGGFLYGGRGGLLLYRSLRIGVDYSAQSLKRDTLQETTTGTYTRQSVTTSNKLLGAIFGFDIPYTPLQGSVTRYFNAKLPGDGASSGDGWGFGASFVLKNPFILSFEKRMLTYTAKDITGKKADGSTDQYYVLLSFMLL